MTSNLTIRPAVAADVPAISRIYNDAILNSTATFSLEAETEAERLAWLNGHTSRNPVLVAELDGTVAAWASLSPYSPRGGYRYTAEDSIYVDTAFRGQGIGRKLFDALIIAGREAGLRTIIARISMSQTVSVALHRSIGFKDVGILRGVGEKFGKLLDVCVLQYTYAPANPDRTDTESS